MRTRTPHIQTRSPRPPRRLAALVALTTVAAAAGCADAGAAAPPTERPVAVRTVPVRHGPIREALRYVGTVASQQEVAVPARLAGTVEALPVKVGGRAARGQVLARISTPETSARVGQVRAELARARTEADYLCDRFETDQRLAEKEVLAGAQLDASRRACEGARSAEAAASSALAQATAQARKSVETAPFDGWVLDWQVEQGQHVMPGQPLAVFGGEALEVRVHVAEEDVRRGIVVGTPVRLFGEDGIDAKVTWVGALARGPARAVEVRIALPEDDGPRPAHGMSVDVAFVLAEDPDAAAVPRRALSRREEGTFVFAVRDGRLERLPVRPGIEERGWVAIEPAPNGNTRVAVGDVDALEDGAPVYPVADREVQQ